MEMSPSRKAINEEDSDDVDLRSSLLTPGQTNELVCCSLNRNLGSRPMLLGDNNGTDIMYE